MGSGVSVRISSLTRLYGARLRAKASSSSCKSWRTEASLSGSSRSLSRACTPATFGQMMAPTTVLFRLWRPTTQTSSISSLVLKRSSSSSGMTFSPESSTMTDLLRPVIQMLPSSSIRPRSPVRNQSPTLAALVSSGAFQ